MKDRIATVDATRSILEKYQINPKNRYGQNFLVVPTIPSLISSFDDINSNSLVIEIGPGLGSLTQYLLEKAKKVICYEIDTQLASILKESLSDYSNLEIINKDFLIVDLDSIEYDKYDNVVFVSNLPYYITSEILIKLLSYKKTFKIIAMMQKEVAHRILNKEDLNELVIYSHLFSNVSKITEVSKNDFFPKPNVDSTVLRFDCLDLEDKYKYFGIINSLYSQRRKTIFNNLKIINGKEINEYFIDYILEINNLTRLTRIDDLSFDKLRKLIESIKDNIYLKAPAKVNLGLNILGKQNSLHLFKSIFIPISLYDELEVYITKEGFKCNLDIKDNSMKKIYDNFNKEYIGLDINIKKNIPVGKGLGGGSSDAGTIASLISKVFKLSKEETIDLTLSAGTDAVYFLDPKIKLQNQNIKEYDDINLDLSEYNLHLLIPEESKETKTVFDEYDKRNKEHIVQDFDDIFSLRNDLEDIILSFYPEINKMISSISNYSYLSMTGAGTAFYYLVKKNEDKFLDDPYLYKIID